MKIKRCNTKGIHVAVVITRAYDEFVEKNGRMPSILEKQEMVWKCWLANNEQTKLLGKVTKQNIGTVTGIIRSEQVGTWIWDSFEYHERIYDNKVAVNPFGIAFNIIGRLYSGSPEWSGRSFGDAIFVEEV